MAAAADDDRRPPAAVSNFVIDIGVSLDCDATSHATIERCKSKISRISLTPWCATIRYYHQRGLLTVPEPGTTWRSHGFVHLSRLRRIRRLVESGVPLAEVPQMLRPPGSADERSLVIEDLDAVLDSIDQKITLLSAQRERVQILSERVTAHGRPSPDPAVVPVARRSASDNQLMVTACGGDGG